MEEDSPAEIIPLRIVVADILCGKICDEKSLKKALGKQGLHFGNFRGEVLLDSLEHSREYAEILFENLTKLLQSWGCPVPPQGPEKEGWKQTLIQRGKQIIDQKVRTGWATSQEGEKQFQSMREAIDRANVENVAARAKSNWDAKTLALAVLAGRFNEVPREKCLESIVQIARHRKDLGRRERLGVAVADLCVIHEGEHFPATLVAAGGVNKCNFSDLTMGIEPPDILEAIPNLSEVLVRLGFQVIRCGCST